MKIRAVMSKRFLKLWKFCLMMMLMVVFVLGYVFLVDFVKEHIYSLRKVGFSWNNATAATSEGSPSVIESYCKYRNEKKIKMTGQQTKDSFLHRPSPAQAGQVCIHPNLEPCDPSIAVLDESVQKVQCSTEENWVYVDNGTFRLSSWARWKYGKIACEYAPIVRGSNDYSAQLTERVKPMMDGSPLITDFFKVACVSPSGRQYQNIHVGVAYNQTLHLRSRKRRLPVDALAYDILMLGFDSTSRMAWLRNLPRTRKFFLQVLGGLELEGYNIVGDGTVQALLPILTGHAESDLHSARKDENGATQVDDFPWIWDRFKEAGYVTAWAEDMAYIGTFQMRLKGFLHQPTDHSMRPYFLMAEPMYRHFLPWCAGSEVRHMRFLNWFRELYHMYGNKPKFMFGFHSEYSHNSINNLKKIDADLNNLLKYLHSSGYLNHTILVLMGDHGSRFSNLRATPQGKLEERMPYFAFSFPPSLVKSHPKAITNFKINTHRLTTPFDVHETFLDVLNFKNTQDYTNKRGISLFKEVPRNRSCEDASIELHWCACLQWTKVKNPGLAKVVAEAVMQFLNEKTAKVRNLCAMLTVVKIISMSQVSPNVEVLQYKKSLDHHGDFPDMTDNMTLNYNYYQIALVTEPGSGHFEVTVKYSTVTKEFFISDTEMSRTNRYHNASLCIQHKYPHLRAYCFCV